MSSNIESKERYSDENFKIQEVNVTVPWGIISSKCWGDPSSYPVLVVHGIQDNAGSFDRLIPLLPRCYYYVCLELPGHGKSTRIPEGIPLGIMLFISCIHRFVKHFSWTEYYYMGHSLGGQIGVYYSAMYSEQVKKLITIDSIPLFSQPTNKFFKMYRKDTENLVKLEDKISNSSPPSYTYEEAVERLLTRRPSPITRAAAEALVKRMLKSGKSGFHFSTDQRLKLGVKNYMPLEQSLCNISKVQCPYLNILTNITYGYYDKVDSDIEGKLILQTFKQMENVKLVIVDGVHDVHNNEPEVVATHIRNFLVHKKSSL